MVDTTALGPERSAFLQNHLNPVLHDMVTELIAKQPEDTLDAMVEWLKAHTDDHDFKIDESKLRTVAANTGALEKILAENANIRKQIEACKSKINDCKFDLKASANMANFDGADAMVKSIAMTADQFKNEDEEEEEDDEDELLDDIALLPTNTGTKARTSVSAEAYGAWNQKKDFTPPVYEKSTDQSERLTNVLNKSFLFSVCDDKMKDILVKAMQEQTPSAGETVIQQGDDGDFLFVVESGDLECFKKFNDDPEEKMVKAITAGDVVGELALLYNAPRAATVKVKSDTAVLWKLDRETFNNIVKDAAANKREKYENIMKNIKILSTLDQYERAQIIDALKESTYAAGDEIIVQGAMSTDDGNKFFMLTEGTAVALRDGAEVKSYTEGDYFGELALLADQPRQATIKVTSEKAKCVFLESDSFRRLMGNLVDLLTREAAANYA